MNEDEPTQELRRTPPQAPMPGPLNPAQAPRTEPDPTGVLPLDELLDGGDEEPVAVPHAASPRPPMPVVPVRSSTDARSEPGGYGQVADRLRADTAAVLSGATTRTVQWMRHDDNGLMIVTSLMAALLLAVVFAFGG